MVNTECRLSIDENSQDKSALTCKENDTVEVELKRPNKLGRCRSRGSKVESPLDCGVDADGELPVQGVPSSREERVSSLKTVSLEKLFWINGFCLLFCIHILLS